MSVIPRIREQYGTVVKPAVHLGMPAILTLI